MKYELENNYVKKMTADSPSWVWKRMDLHNTVVENLPEEMFKDIAATETGREIRIIVGSDSQTHKYSTRFVTAVALWRVGAGGRVYYKVYKKRHKDGKRMDNRARLIEEAYDSIKVAMWLNPELNKVGLGVHEIETLHADLNRDKKYLSNSVVAGVLGTIKAHGFEGIIKPEGWVASRVANRRTK